MQLNGYFERAVQDEKFRQRFLDDISSRSLPEYVSRLVYRRNQRDSYTVMETCPNPLAAFRIKGTKSRIEVFPNSFEPLINSLGCHNNLDDFLSTLEDHEYFHARELYYNPEIIAVPPFTRTEYLVRSTFDLDFDGFMDRIKNLKDNSELRALNNQIINFSNRNCSLDYMAARIRQTEILNLRCK